MEGGGVPHQPTHSLPLETLPGCLPRARNLKNLKTFLIVFYEFYCLLVEKGGLMEGGGVPHQPTHSLPLETLPGCLPRARNLKNLKTFLIVFYEFYCLSVEKGGLMEGGGVPHQPTHSLPLETLPGCLPRDNSRPANKLKMPP
jgi:hypothetical protein